MSVTGLYCKTILRCKLCGEIVSGVGYVGAIEHYRTKHSGYAQIVAFDSEEELSFMDEQFEQIESVLMDGDREIGRRSEAQL